MAQIKTKFIADLAITTAKINTSAVTTAKIANDAVDKDKIAADVAGAGLGQNVDGSLEINVDNSTVEINTDTLRVKDAGVTEAKLSASVAGAGLTGGAGSALAVGAGSAVTVNANDVAVRVDSSTIKVNGSNNLEALKPTEQLLTLTGTDITNQYVDLSFAAYGTSASINSVHLAAEGVVQTKTVDYTVSLTGGAGGVTRVTFAGDLATGGAAELVAGDKLVATYSYLT